MCSSDPPDPSAELRRQEAERQAKVAQGTQRIDEIFSGFNDGFYDARKQAEMDYYLPQVDDQYKQSYADAVARLANSGNLTSTAGADLLGRINKQYELSKQGVLDRAASSALGLKSTMAGNRANLISQLSSGSDIESVASNASAIAQAQNATPAYSPLGDLFSGITANIANSMLAKAITGPQQGVGPGVQTTGKKSAVTYVS